MNSPVTIANAREKRSDAFTSLAALVGVFGARMGIKVLDRIAAIIVGFMIARFGLDTLLEGVKGISDRSFDKQLVSDVRNLILKEKGKRIYIGYGPGRLVRNIGSTLRQNSILR